VSLAVQRDLDAVRTGLERWLGRPVTRLERPAPGFSCETLLVAVEGLVFKGFPELPPSSIESRNSGFR
jgi:hypothetical protein